MDKFSFTRVILLLKKFINEEKYRLLGIICVGTLLIIMGSWISNTFSTNIVKPDGSATFGIFSIIAIFFTGGLQMCYCSAHALPYMSSKADHIAYTLLPASTNEKFVTALINSIIVPIFLFLITYGLSELLHLIFFQECLTKNVISSYLLYTENFALYENITLTHIVKSLFWLFVTGWLFGCAWFLCSATIFRKHPFLMGVVVNWALSQILSMILLFIFGYNVFANIIDISTISNTLITIISISMVGTLVLWVVAYLRIKNAQP